MKKDSSLIYLLFALGLMLALGFGAFNDKKSVPVIPETEITKTEPAKVATTPKQIKPDTFASSIKRSEKPKKLTFSEFMKSAQNKNIKSVVINETSAKGEFTDGKKFSATIVYDAGLLSKLTDMGVDVKLDESKSFWSSVVSLLPLILTLLFIIWIFRSLRGGGASSGGLGGLMQRKIASVALMKGKVSFKDVAGIDEAKEEVSELVDFLKNPDKFSKLGGRSPKGVLMYGAPGTGKTLLARAIAGEADVPFFSASGSDFSGILVGLGVSRVRDLFEIAKKNAPCIIFIDEIDAIGQHRGKGIMPSDQDREQTLNQLLIEMDGFSSNSGVLVIGATNRADVLDPALLRPGRFDRQVHIDLPDYKGRLDILNLYAKKVKLGEKIDLSVMARGTVGFSGAELENLLNEAALYAVRQKHTEIEQTDLEEARDKIMMGPKKAKKLSEKDIKLTAYHEAGHAMVSVHFTGICDPIHKATIVPRGMAMGMVQRLPETEKNSMTLAEVRGDLAVAMAGRVSEEVFFGADKITTGAAGDIAMATNLARRVITMGGMSKKIGMVAINETEVPWGQKKNLENVSDKTMDLVDSEIKTMIDSAYITAKKIITKNKATVEKIAKTLLEKETLTRQEIETIVKKPTTKKSKK